jgi:hypothetical protein
MRAHPRIPGARLAFGAFLLTVLLGAGGTSAVALWQQSATAEITVSAAASWPGPVITLTCADAPNDSVKLTVTSSATPTQISIASRLMSGTYGGEYNVSPVSMSVVISATSYGIPETLGANKNVPIAIRVTATFEGGSSSAEMAGFKITGNNTRIACP